MMRALLAFSCGDSEDAAVPCVVFQRVAIMEIHSSQCGRMSACLGSQGRTSY